MDEPLSGLESHEAERTGMPMKKTLACAEDLAVIRQRIARLTPDAERQWGSMSVNEMVCHLRDSYEIGLGQRSASEPATRPPIPLALYKRLALYAPVKWPTGVSTVPEVDARVGGTPPAEFAADLDRLLQKLDEFVQCPGPFPPHPFFGPMSGADWMRWGFLHADHHLRQFGM